VPSWSLPTLYDFIHSVGAIFLLCQFWENENIWKYKEGGTQCLQSCNGRHFTWMENELSKLRKNFPIWMKKKTTFSSLQHDTTFCKHAMNAIMWAVWSTPVMWINFILSMKNLRGSSNLHMNLQLHVTCKLTALSLQQNTFQKPWTLAYVFHLNYSCKQVYPSGQKLVLQNS